MSRSFFEAVKNRRTVYALGKNKVVSKDRIREIAEFAVLNSPSAFNSQSGRVVVLFDAESSRFWNIAREALRKIVPPEAFAKTEEKIASFDAGYGTVLFFEDQSVVEGLMTGFPLYRDNFPVWSLESNGMMQFTVWSALEDEGLGASLQHYNPLVDEDVRKAWQIPETWKLLAEMPFGSVVAAAGEKEYQPVDSRLKVFG